MARIDKIYGTNENWQELLSWLAIHRPQYIKFMYPAFGYTDDRPITNLPKYADKWLWKNCNIKWVRDELKLQYGGKGPR